MIQQIINDEKFTNIQKAQAGLTRLLINAEKTASFYTVMRNDKPVGTLIPRKMWESLMEDLEALSSPNYRKFIVESRADKRVTADQIRKLTK
jgi:PHD/YefM family antitoxin component YafN of YafNO toxin-antitoxin module